VIGVVVIQSARRRLEDHDGSAAGFVLGLELQDAVPDAKTIWLFREQLTKAGAIDELFSSFDAYLKAQGFLAMSGQIVDATIVAAPRQRKIEDEKKTIKEGRIPEDWRGSRRSSPKKTATRVGP
jgi:IS5 family transposase